MIESNGDVFPCHVLKETEKRVIGNVYEDRLQIITQKLSFSQLRNSNVNSNRKCRQCDIRYLCGGVCKIRENQDCSDLYIRAKYLLNDDLKICNVSSEEF
jgi:radical SAM protein with 4Fe4S-binding SPASM domain